MAKKKTSNSRKNVNKTNDSKTSKQDKKLSLEEQKRTKLNKKIFFGSWIIWAVIMIPKYLPDKCAAFFEPVLHASFTCPPVSLGISIILGSLFMAFVTWIIGWIATWLYFYHQELTWDNIQKWLKE